MAKIINVSKDQFNRGVFLFENGKYIYIEEIQYSADGTFWEDTFIPYEHPDSRNLSNKIEPHQYRRVRHAGDDFFQHPEYIVAKDGKTPMFKVENNIMYIKYMDEVDEAYVELFDMDNVKGAKGDKGDTGTGWNINLATWWLDRPDCCDSIQPTVQNCTSCSPTITQPSTANNIKLMLSLGDGKKVIELSDIGNFRSNAGDVWIAIGANDVGNETRFIAEDAIGTNQIDYRKTDNLNTRGKVYYCSGESWELLFNVAIPDYLLSPNSTYYTNFQSGLYMEDYVHTEVDSVGTIYMDSEFKLRVKLNSINASHLEDGTFGDGLDEGTANVDGIKTSPIKVNAEAIMGFGLSSYVSNSDGYVNLEVDSDALVSDGLAIDPGTPTDGEDRNLIKVNVEDLLNTTPTIDNPEYPGLTVITSNTDGYDDLYVKPGKGVEVNSDGVNVKVDYTSLDISEEDEVTIKEFITGDDGVNSIHLNTSVANGDKAIGLNHNDGLELKLSTDHIALEFDPNGVLIGNHKVEGWHLASNVANSTSGALLMDLVNDAISVMVKANGGLIIVANEGLAMDPNNLDWLTDQIVNKIQIGNNKLVGEVVFVGDTLNNYVNINVTNTNNVVKIEAEVDIAALQAALIDLDYAAINHTHPISDITGLEDELDARPEYDVMFGNITLKSGTSGGLFITKNGTIKKLELDDNFDLILATPQ